MNPRNSSGDLTREQAIIFNEVERVRIAQGFHDRVAPELSLAMFELYEIQTDLQSRGLPESAELQKVADRINAGIHEFLAVLNPPNEEVRQADSRSELIQR